MDEVNVLTVGKLKKILEDLPDDNLVTYVSKEFGKVADSPYPVYIISIATSAALLQSKDGNNDAIGFYSSKSECISEVVTENRLKKVLFNGIMSEAEKEFRKEVKDLPSKTHKFDNPPNKEPVRGYYGHYYWNGIEYVSEDEAWEDYNEWKKENNI